MTRSWALLSPKSALQVWLGGARAELEPGLKQEREAGLDFSLKGCVSGAAFPQAIAVPSSRGIKEDLSSLKGWGFPL